jgi:hypothetical protein
MKIALIWLSFALAACYFGFWPVAIAFVVLTMFGVLLEAVQGR